MSLRRTELLKIPIVKELIKLEEKSVRTLTMKEILKDTLLDKFADVTKALPFAEEEEEETAEGDVTEVEEEEEAAVELGEVEEGEETETS